MMYIFILALLVKSIASYGGYDSGGGNTNTCGRPYRAGKMHIPPCSLNKEGGYCVTAGDNYPWRAVRRFVNENQGLMKRMYGDQAEDSLLREEFARMASFVERHPRADPPQDIENELSKNEDDFDFKNEYEIQFEGRLLHDEDVLKTKFIYSEEPTLSLKLAGLKTAPHFRQVTSTSTEIPTTSTTTSTITTSSPTTTTSKINDTTTRNIVFPEAQDDMDDSTTASLREVDEISGTTESTLEPTSSTSSGEQNVKSTSPAPITTSTEEVIEDDATVVETDQSGTVLFQDMDEEASKVKVDYKMAGVNACPVRVDIVAPYWANNSRGEVLALLNMYPFQQYVHLEKCTHENRQMYCRDGCRCEQQYRLHRLLAYDPKNECKGIFSDWFRFPSCCLCKCYGLPPEFRVTSRSPRHKGQRWYNTVPNED